MKKIVMDTSSLISLQMIGILQQSFKIMKIIIPKAVEKEINEISSYKDMEGKSADKILEHIKNGIIEVVGVKNKKKVENLLSRNINFGEAECFVACLEQNVSILIMDDVDAAYSLEGLTIANRIKIKISVAVLIELWKEKIITKSELKSFVDSLIKIREWEGGVLEVLGRKYLENM